MDLHQPIEVRPLRTGNVRYELKTPYRDGTTHVHPQCRRGWPRSLCRVFGLQAGVAGVQAPASSINAWARFNTLGWTRIFKPAAATGCKMLASCR